jgi:uncharacterized protein (TIGR04255 family)
MVYEESCYDKPFLREVVGRLDFVASLDVLEKGLPSKLAKVLSEHFPISEPVDAIAREYQLTIEQVKQWEKKFKQWNFFGKDREKQLSLTPQYVFVSYKRYTTFENMKSEFGSVVDALGKAFPDIRVARFGLRYVNSIDIEDLPTPSTWDRYINEQLLRTTAFFSEPSDLVRLIQIAELRYGDLNVRFQFGMPNPDYPAMMRRPQFILDLDAYVQTAHDPSESLQYMEEAHVRIQDLFERSITMELRERMNAKSTTSIRE